MNFQEQNAILERKLEWLNLGTSNIPSRTESVLEHAAPSNINVSTQYRQTQPNRLYPELNRKTSPSLGGGGVYNPIHQQSEMIGDVNYQLGRDMWKQMNRVGIPEFTGDKKTYQSWKAAFYSWVDNAPATPEYKLLQLRTSVKGEALKLIEGLGHSAAAYESAKERLERKYGGLRPQIAINLDELDNF